MKKPKYILALLLLIAGLSSCNSPKKIAQSSSEKRPALLESRLVTTLNNNFSGLEMPTLSILEAKSLKQSFPHTSFKELVKAAQLLLIQKGVLILKESQEGIFLYCMNSTPSFLFVERGEKLQAHWVQLNQDLLPQWNQIQQGKDLMLELSTQVYAPKKWAYIYEQ